MSLTLTREASSGSFGNRTGGITQAWGRAMGALKTPAYMVQLDSLRAVAALVVIASHYQPDYFKQYNWGYAAVLLFFVISGFLITGILLRTRERIEDSCETPVDGLKNFYLRRTLRIFPLYYLVSLFAICYFPEARETWGWHLGYSVNFLMAQRADFVGATTPFWSLGVEEQFYLLWPLVIFFTPMRWLLPIMGGMVLTGPISRLICLNFSYQAFAYFPTSCFDSLGLGALLAFCRHTGIPVQRRWLRQWPAFSIGAFAAFYAYSVYDTSLRPSFDVLAPFWMSITFACIVAVASTGYKGAVGKILQFRPLVYLGRISYGLYVYHCFAPFLTVRIIRGLGISLEGGTFQILAVLLTIILSSLSWHFFERPFNTLKDRFQTERKMVVGIQPES
jgi:peptidoglycan/LPS O-acetylase OafA/YrhL